MALRLLLWLGAEPGAASAWFALALTYLAHSVIWAAASALFVRAGSLSPGTRHLCWKVALLGPLLTAWVATAVEGSNLLRLHAPYVQYVGVPSFAAPLANIRLPAPTAELDAQSSTLAAVVLGAAGLGLLSFVASALVLGYRLRRRARVTNPELLARLERWCARMGLRDVRLTESEQIRSPLVLGRREICLPCPLPGDLSNAELDTVFAHELAHIERADGVWFPIIGVVQSVLWLNPLNHWLASSVRSSAELACDDRAVELTRDPLGLARALVQVATGASLGRPFASLPTMGRSKSAILPRVRRLTSPAAAEPGHDRARGRRWVIVASTSLACVLGTLSIQVARANARPRAALSSLAASPPAPSEQTSRMAELAAREQRILAELRASRRTEGAVPDGPSEAVRELELSQELRHVRENQAWLEAQLVSDWDSSRARLRSSRAAR